MIICVLMANAASSPVAVAVTRGTCSCSGHFCARTRGVFFNGRGDMVESSDNENVKYIVYETHNGKISSTNWQHEPFESMEKDGIFLPPRHTDMKLASLSRRGNNRRDCDLVTAYDASYACPAL